jgi:hypothetical protein
MCPCQTSKISTRDIVPHAITLNGDDDDDDDDDDESENPMAVIEPNPSDFGKDSLDGHGGDTVVDCIAAFRTS